VLLCVPAPAVAEALTAAALPSGAIVVDCTNPVRWDAGPVWAPPAEGSVARALSVGFPALRIVKGFNHFGAEIQGDPTMAGGAADAWFAGDDAEAKAVVMAMASRMGFRAVDAGPLRNASVLENVAMLWIHLASVGGQGRQFAFRADHRP
jgi:8-hydroxy-5-deazaflavin:NADPH oxidoreductase